MNKSKPFYCFILIPFLLSGISCRYNPEKQNPYFYLFQSLQGNWAGCAIKTPVGPRPYDIHFWLDEKGDLNGIADPGPVSDHHWSYQIDGDVLWLKFLSSFRGNEEPVWLSAVEKRGMTVTFRSKKVQKLKVEVTVIDNTQKIEIYLHNKPHVSIHLVRGNANINSRSECN
jgi:hypothetical protein